MHSTIISNVIFHKEMIFVKGNYVKVPLLQQREIEMKVLGPLVRAFVKEFGEERTFDIVRRTMQGISLELGRAAGAASGGGLDALKSNCIAVWNEGGALESTTLEDSSEAIRFDVTRCAFADLYKELGYGDIGALISCDRDASFIEGFDPKLELVRSKTIMAGDDICDFCYRKKITD